MICALLAACDATGPKAAARFGQTGETRVTVETPLHLGVGRLRQTLRWKSDGWWEVREEIRYRGAVGDEDVRHNPGIPLRYAGNYATLIQSLNDHEGQKLIGVPELDVVKDPECEPGTSRVAVLIVDDKRRENREWTRCASGSLGTLTTRGSGPDAVAARVVQAAITVRNFTVGSDFRSTYLGSLPFSTVEKGTETRLSSSLPLVFRSPDGESGDSVQLQWTAFWAAHRGSPAAAAPEVDWDSEMALVGLVGVRDEVGDSVEVRSVITVANGTKVELVERIPGDFCAPANRPVQPFHIVLAPKVPAPVFFAPVKRELVPCGV